ncbi:MAG: class I SAM-dependent methyltransferase [Cardiobacteriaceae bacterium]|nr:class I SAM-dependent methyltransferase [Cardiobacteriaceae bacterium]
MNHDHDFSLPTMRSAWLEPEHLSSPAPWAGHIPFAAWLMAVMRPRTLVELGVYSGISYLAFCQAAVAHQVTLRMWGVDTWQGDAHAGSYDGERILNTLRERHDERYGHFSTLLRKTFDEALADIADGSIDLLHIDGLHTYEAVRHDFETWQPKLSERGVVLFHDMAVREGDFGVWRYWEELTQRFPGFAFVHSNGLGVLLVGREVPEALRVLAEDGQQLAQMQVYCRALGERFERRAERLHLDTVIADLQEKIQSKDDWINMQDKQLEAKDCSLMQQEELMQQKEEETRKILKNIYSKLEELQNKKLLSLQKNTEALQQKELLIQQKNTEILQFRKILQDTCAQLYILQKNETAVYQVRRMLQDTRAQLRILQKKETEIRQVRQELQDSQSDLRVLQNHLQSVLQSRSWRITAGLRYAGRQVRNVRKWIEKKDFSLAMRRMRKALAYIVTGNWRELMQRVRHIRKQESHIQHLHGFEDTGDIRCGILATPHTLFVAHVIAVVLQDMGISVQAVEESVDYPLDLYFVVCPQMFKHLPPGEKRIAFQMEQSVSSRWFTPEYLATLENSLAVLDYSRANLKKLAEYGIVFPHVYFAPIGGIVAYSETQALPVREEDACEVLFYGDAHAPRRRRLLDAIGKHFKLRIIGNAFGAEMQQALAAAKVVVNIHYYEGALLETTRIYECLSLGKSVVSEVSADQEEHGELDGVVRFVPLDDEEALIAALREALAEQESAEGRVAYGERCQAVVAASQKRFTFMISRLLLAQRVIDYPTFTKFVQPVQQLASRMALSLPETVVRREAFTQVAPADVALFDGVRYTPGWLGAAMSYKYLAQCALQQGLLRLEIMEDDVEFPPDYDTRRARVNAWLDAHEGQWDAFVGVMAQVHPDTEILAVERVDGETFVTLDRMISMVGNIYAPSALQRIAAWDESVQDADSNTIDRFLQTGGGMRVVVTLPCLLGHREDLDSSLWGFSNVRYAQMIAEAEQELRKRVDAFERRGV